MSIRDYLTAVLRGWWIVVIGVVVGAGAAILLIATTPPVYAGTVTFFVNTTPSTGVSPLQGDQYAQQRVATYVRLISSHRLAEMVKEDSGSSRSVGEISSSLSGESPLNTVLLTATATGSSQAEVLATVRSVSVQFVTMIREIDPTVSLEITSRPELESSPISPRVTLDIGLGIAAGLVVGAGAAIARRALDTTVHQPADLAAVTGAAVLGAIGRDRRARTAPLLIGAATESSRMEAFRKLRTNLRSLLPHDAAVMVVTSSVYGEGKSVTAANLAVTFANDGREVLLLDADLRRPRVAASWGLAPAPGLSEVLTGSATVDDCLHATAVESLTVLPSGHRPPDPAHLIGSAAMADLLARLRTKFDVIIMDAPPLLPVTDAAIATGMADGALIVVRSGKTHTAQVRNAVSALDAAGAHLWGCVLNRVTRAGRSTHSTPEPSAGERMAG